MTLEESISSIRDIHETRHIQRLATLWSFGTNKKRPIIEQTIPMVQKQKRQKSHGLHAFKSCQTGSPLHQEVRPFTFTGGEVFQTSHMLKLVVSKTKEEINAITYTQNAIKIHVLYIFWTKLSNQQQFKKTAKSHSNLRLEGCRHLWCDDQKAQKAPTVHWTFPAGRVAHRPMDRWSSKMCYQIREQSEGQDNRIYGWFFIHSWKTTYKLTFINITHYLIFCWINRIHLPVL